MLDELLLSHTQNIRSLGVKLKLSSTKSLVKSKSIILIDDSLLEEQHVIKLLKCFTKLEQEKFTLE